MKQTLFLLSLLMSVIAHSQTPYVPTDPSNIKLPVIINNTTRSVLIADLTKNKVDVTKHSIDSAALKLDISTRFKYLSVATYAAMISSGIPQTPIIYKVAADEKNNPGRVSIYEYWPDGDIIWIAGQKVN